MRDDRLEKLADVLVNYSTEVTEGDIVAISAEDCALPFIQAVARAAVKKGALVEYYVDVPEVDAEVLKHGSREQYARPNIRFGACAASDVWISAWGSRNTKMMQSIPSERLKERRLANRENRKKYSDRMGSGELRWCGTQFPTEADAQNAAHTYTIESLMHDGKALQSGTSHNFGDGFARAFDIQYTDKDNQLQYVHQTSWGMTTRLIGAIIMVHGDNSGLVLPPKIAPIQLVIVPIAQHKEGVLEKAMELKNKLSAVCRVKLDDSDKSAGWKFSEYEMKGVPIRLEIGPKDIAQNQAVLARRDTGEKIVVSLDELEKTILALLDSIQANLLQKATERRDSKTYLAHNMEEFEQILNETPGFIKAMWCGDQACEDAIKEKTAATSRCIPFEQEEIDHVCVCCGKPAKHMVYWGRAY